MSALTRDSFTDAHRRALSAAASEADRTLRADRMTLAERFCDGNDESAARWDGFVASSQERRDALEELCGFAYGYGVAS